MIVKPPIGASLDFGHPLARGLVGCWLMNDGAGQLAYDASFNGGPASLVSTSWVAGEEGNAIQFGSAPSYATVTNNAHLITDGHDLSIVCRYCITSTAGSYNTVVSSGPSLSSSKPAVWPGYILAHSYNATKPYFAVCKVAPTTYAAAYPAAAAFAIGQWVTVVGVWNNSTATASVYCDGRLLDSGANGDVDAFAGSLYQFGNTVGDTYQQLSGAVSFVATFHRVLTSTEIASLYRDPYQMFRRQPIELWSAAANGGVAGLPIPVAQHHYQQMRGAA